MAPYNVLVVTNLWPSEADASYGSFVQAQMESLRPLGVNYDTIFINGRDAKWNYLRGIRQVRRQIGKKRYDLIHAHFGLSGWVARFQFRVPLVVSFLGDDVLGRYTRTGRVSLLGRILPVSSYVLARCASAVIVKSPGMRARLGLASAEVIPNGVDLELFAPRDRAEARRRLGLDEGKKYVLFPFDRAIQNKRYDLVEQAVARARAEIPALEILEVSRAPRAAMPDYMNAADMLVLVSHSEGSPNAVKEAMATNLPVVAANVGDVANVIEGVDGCHLVTRDPDDIAARIVDVCRRDARTRGREKVASLAMNLVAARVVAVYEKVLGRKPAS